jgi:hypothetical protein
MRARLDTLKRALADSVYEIQKTRRSGQNAGKSEGGLSERPHRVRIWAPRGQTRVVSLVRAPDHL